MATVVPPDQHILYRSGRPIGELSDRLSQPLDPRRTAAAGEWKEEKWGGREGARAEARTRKLGMTSLGAPLGGDLLEGGLHMTNGVPYV